MLFILRSKFMMMPINLGNMFSLKTSYVVVLKRVDQEKE